MLAYSKKIQRYNRIITKIVENNQLIKVKKVKEAKVKMDKIKMDEIRTDKAKTARVKTDKLGQGQPRYVQAYKNLLDKITDMAPDTKLPAEEALAEEFGISRNTLRQALQTLHEDKLIYKRKGAGTFVSGAPYLGKNDLGYYSTGSEMFKQLGIEVAETELAVTIEDIDKITGNMLEAQEVATMYYVSRVFESRNAAGIRLCYCEDYIPCSQRLDLAKLGREGFIRAYEQLGTSSISNITAVAAGGFHSAKLRVEKGTPLIVLQQLVLDENGKKIYLNKTYFNTDTTENSLVIYRHSIK